MSYEIEFATVHTVKTTGAVRKGSKVATLMTDAGGGVVDGKKVEGPFVYHEEGGHKAPEVGETYSINFRRAKDMAQSIWTVKCLSHGSIPTKDGGYLTFEKVG
jgi:hypothetical protein